MGSFAITRWSTVQQDPHRSPEPTTHDRQETVKPDRGIVFQPRD